MTAPTYPLRVRVKREVTMEIDAVNDGEAEVVIALINRILEDLAKAVATLAGRQLQFTSSSSTIVGITHHEQ